MKTAIALIFAILAPSASAQNPFDEAGQRAEYYRKRGLSMQEPPVARVSYPISKIPQGSPRFQAVFAQTHAAYPRLTIPTFLAELQQGKTFDVTKTEPIASCKDCNGFGWIADAKSTSPDKKSQCQKCKGVGKVAVRTHLRICWEASEAKP